MPYFGWIFAILRRVSFVLAFGDSDILGGSSSPASSDARLRMAVSRYGILFSGVARIAPRDAAVSRKQFIPKLGLNWTIKFLQLSGRIQPLKGGGSVSFSRLHMIRVQRPKRAPCRKTQPVIWGGAPLDFEMLFRGSSTRVRAGRFRYAVSLFSKGIYASSAVQRGNGRIDSRLAIGFPRKCQISY